MSFSWWNKFLYFIAIGSEIVVDFSPSSLSLRFFSSFPFFISRSTKTFHKLSAIIFYGTRINYSYILIFYSFFFSFWIFNFFVFSVMARIIGMCLFIISSELILIRSSVEFMVCRCRSSSLLNFWQHWNCSWCGFMRFWQRFSSFWQFLGILNKFWAVFSTFWQFWTNFEQYLAHFDSFEPIFRKI